LRHSLIARATVTLRGRMSDFRAFVSVLPTLCPLDSKQLFATGCQKRSCPLRSLFQRHPHGIGLRRCRSLQ
jgi:hypothetical protein